MTERILQFALIALGALPVWLLLRKPWRRRPLRELVMGTFILFMTALLVMALEGLWTSPVDMIQRAAERIKSRTNLHFTPFMTIRQQMATLSTIESVVQLLGNTLLGFLALWTVNLTAGITGIALGLNLMNALVIGILGLPGFVLLLLVQWVL